MVNFMMRQNKWYPRPHDIRCAWGHDMESGVENNSTIIPIVMYDEGQGDPSSYTANPENASFAEYTGPNCYPDSRINNITTTLKFSMTRELLNMNVDQVRCAFMVIATSFKNDLDATDELSTLNTADVLELQSESTDRQAYPLYNGVDMTEPWVGASLQHTDVPGLTTNQTLEGVTFQSGTFYDMLHYSTISRKLQKLQYGLKWFTLTRDRPFKNIRINLKRKTKRLNEYTQLSVLIFVPPADNYNQLPTISGNITSARHVSVDLHSRYNEWNQDFNFRRQ